MVVSYEDQNDSLTVLALVNPTRTTLGTTPFSGFPPPDRQQDTGTKMGSGRFEEFRTASQCATLLLLFW